MNDIQEISSKIITSVNNADNRIINANTKTNEKFMHDFSNILTNTLKEIKDPFIESYIINQQAKFDENLKWFQKYIPFVNTNENSFIRKTRFKAGLMNYGLEISITALEILLKTGIIQHWKNKYIDYPKIFKSLLNSYLYINNLSEMESSALMRLMGMMDKKSINDSAVKIETWINEYNQKQIHNFSLPSYYQNDLSFVALYLKSLSRLCNTEEIVNRESDTYKNLEKLSTDYFGVTQDEFNLILSTSINENILLSSVLDLAQFSFHECLQDLLQNIQYSQQRINFLNDADPFKIKRDTIKKNVLKTGSLFAAGGLTFLTGGVGDFLIATTAPLLVNSFDDQEQNLSNEINLRFNELMQSKRKAKLSDHNNHETNEEVDEQ